MHLAISHDASVFHLIETTHHQQNEMQKQSSILENGITSVR